MDSYNKLERLRNEYGVKISGIPLDGENQDTITYSMLENLQSIICYDYEDGKPWHDVACVMEIIFHNKHHEIMRQDEQRIRFLYFHPKDLLEDIAKLNSFKSDTSSLTAIRMDLTGGYCQHDYKDDAINFGDFETFNCMIKHKKHFHPKNPEMPDD